MAKHNLRFSPLLKKIIARAQSESIKLILCYISKAEMRKITIPKFFQEKVTLFMANNDKIASQNFFKSLIEFFRRPNEEIWEILARKPPYCQQQEKLQINRFAAYLFVSVLELELNEIVLFSNINMDELNITKNREKKDFLVIKLLDFFEDGNKNQIKLCIFILKCAQQLANEANDRYHKLTSENLKSLYNDLKKKMEKMAENHQPIILRCYLNEVNFISSTITSNNVPKFSDPRVSGLRKILEKEDLITLIKPYTNSNDEENLTKCYEKIQNIAKNDNSIDLSENDEKNKFIKLRDILLKIGDLFQNDKCSNIFKLFVKGHFGLNKKEKLLLQECCEYWKQSENNAENKEEPIIFNQILKHNNNTEKINEETYIHDEQNMDEDEKMFRNVTTGNLP